MGASCSSENSHTIQQQQNGSMAIQSQQTVDQGDLSRDSSWPQNDDDDEVEEGLVDWTRNNFKNSSFIKKNQLHSHDGDDQSLSRISLPQPSSTTTPPPPFIERMGKLNDFQIKLHNLLDHHHHHHQERGRVNDGFEKTVDPSIDPVSVPKFVFKPLLSTPEERERKEKIFAGILQKSCEIKIHTTPHHTPITPKATLAVSHERQIWGNDE